MIVDVLAFSTAVTVSVGRGTAVYPHPWPSPGVEAFAAARDAVWAVRRHEVSADHPWSLSPAHLLSGPAPERLVLPSPNGSAIAEAAPGGNVLTGSIRNATAVARWLNRRRFGTLQRPVAIVAAGERWPGEERWAAGELRPALEDLLGAGAIITALSPRCRRSPEAAAAESIWRSSHDRIGEFLRQCSSGQELTAAGYGGDITLAAEHDAQEAVAVLIDSAFRNDNGRHGGPVARDG